MLQLNTITTSLSVDFTLKIMLCFVLFPLYSVRFEIAVDPQFELRKMKETVCF